MDPARLFRALGRGGRRYLYDSLADMLADGWKVVDGISEEGGVRPLKVRPGYDRDRLTASCPDGPKALKPFVGGRSLWSRRTESNRGPTDYESVC